MKRILSLLGSQGALARAFAWVSSTLALVLFLFVFVAQVFHIPTPSMVPTLEVGDMVVVSKYSYGLRPYSLVNRVPVGEGWAFLGRAPRRGDVVVVRNPKGGKGDTALVIKRVVGLPGDDIRLLDGKLEIRTTPVEIEVQGPATSKSEPQIARGGRGFYLKETLPPNLTDGRNVTYFTTDLGPRRDDNFGPFTVPANSLFMLGDNRDNSADSRTRFLGVVPFDNIVGRAQFVLMSWKSGEGDSVEPGWFPLRLDRFFKPL